MIEWMQTHRKWLVITIWIATIAFIGAGFVGWGQFQLSHKEGTVAEVKDTPVSVKDWQDAYSRIFDIYNKQFGGNLDEATAEKLGLKKIALQQAIQDAILRQYAKDLGLYVTDKEVADKILEVFKDTKTYKQYLRNAGMKPAEFEKSLRKKILIEKLLAFLHLKPTNTEIVSVGSALYNADNIDIKVLKKSDISVDLKESDIKNYWEKHKNEFLSNEKYKIALVKIPLDINATDEELKNFYQKNRQNYKNASGIILSFDKVKDKVKIDYAKEKMFKKAILAYKKLKANKTNYEIVTINNANDVIPAEKMQILKKEGIVKPFVYNNSFITAKLLEEIKPKPLNYETAKPFVIEKLLVLKSKQKLIELSKEEYKTFKGENIGFITKYDALKIKDLKPAQAVEFLQKVFISQKPNYFVLIPESNPDVSILYRIKEQKLLYKKEFEQNRENVVKLTEGMINMELLNDLLNTLSQTYKIKVYVK